MVSRQSWHCLPKEAQGKGIASPLDMGAPMGRRSFPSSMDKAKAVALARLHDIFDPNYEPWEELHDDWDHSESEDMETIHSS
ncbi:hypothetical protein RHGRI_037046 [Rhododendron griersonianum]|uniref:Uncharacterized protein n=1 Tax=Rhododendron griersonianum TaxID=479676 RepID=A0AAV6HT76_9ERIC|nr:hypothetical protein RHGRI_037046 [Rhododendron griersonianum]